MMMKIRVFLATHGIGLLMQVGQAFTSYVRASPDLFKLRYQLSLMNMNNNGSREVDRQLREGTHS